MDNTQRAENKKNEIIVAAISMFKQYGIKKTTIEKIALKAKASKVTVYKYFGDRENLYRHVYANLTAVYINELN